MTDDDGKVVFTCPRCGMTSTHWCPPDTATGSELGARAGLQAQLVASHAHGIYWACYRCHEGSALYETEEAASRVARRHLRMTGHPVRVTTEHEVSMELRKAAAP